ncbi:MAG: class I SAM-dependent methyltransferase [Bacteriovoracaceae bacterium]|nr:class I SAM-dependent methyltransferase [Bacteriovoracaceae bacterium]
MRDFSDNLLDLLNDKYGSLNLTRINEPEEFFQKQVLDSILPCDLFNSFSKSIEKGLHLDIGFGGGFPLLPLGHKYPGTKFIGFEARRKKADAVRDIALDLKLKNIKTYHYRIEDILIDVPCSLSFKAVGKISDYIKKINSNKPITVYFYKGPNVKELESVPEKIESFRKVLDEEYDLPGTNGRSFIAYQSANVPRGTKKALVKLSQLI